MAAPRLSLERAVGYIGLFCSVLIVATIAALAVNSRNQLFRDAREEVATASFFLADHASRLFEASDFVINETVEVIQDMSWDEVASSRQLWERFHTIADRLPYVEAIWINDERGELRLTTVSFPTPPSNARDRDFFRAHLEPTLDPYVSSVILGRVTGRNSFLVSRRLSHADGSLAGIVSITADLDYFTKFYGSLRLAYSPGIALFRLEGMGLLATYPPSEDRFTRHKVALAAAVHDSPLEGVVADRQRGQPAATIGYRKVAEVPIYVGVIVDDAQLDRVWLEQLGVYGLLGAAALLPLGILTFFAFRQARRMARVHSELEERVAARTADLVAANDELATLFQEVHHRVKNNLQVVTSLLRLQQMRLDSPQARSALQDSIERIQAMGLVHQLLYSRQELSSVDFSDYVGRLAAQLVDAYGMAERITLDISGSPVRFDLDTAIPLALIVNEVVSNALKHGFPDGRRGRIAIEVSRAADGLRLSIHDDGVGIPEELSLETPPSLGLRIVRSLAAQLGGTAELVRGSGTTFTLAFPDKADQERNAASSRPTPASMSRSEMPV